MSTKKDTKPTISPKTTKESPAEDKKDFQALEAHYKRLLADFDNYKKRTAKDQQYWITQANNQLISHLLPILDDLELAVQAVAGTEKEEAQTTQSQGILLIYKKFLDVLEKQGLEGIVVAPSDTFDAAVHEALSTIPTDDAAKKDTIAQVVQKGYHIDGKTLRFAKVIVYA